MDWGYVVTCSLSCLSLSLAIPISVPSVAGSHLNLGSLDLKVPFFLSSHLIFSKIENLIKI